jgi:pyroglutamyl-peptidase
MPREGAGARDDLTTVLLTGFEPFAGDRANPSGEAVRLVADRWDGPELLVTDVLPVAFGAAADRMRALIARHEPDVVVATGLAGGRSAVTPERVAINLADARIPDNSGSQPIDEPVVAGGPDARFATLPVKAIAAAIVGAGIPSAVSYSAGTFVCNDVMYVALDEASRRDGMRAGFIHVPWATGQSSHGEPELPIHDIATAIEVAVRIALDATHDIATPGGTLH